jgi:hypothetical protein
VQNVQRVLELRRRAPEVTLGERRLRLEGQTLESASVDLLVIDPEPVAARDGLDRLPSEDLA